MIYTRKGKVYTGLLTGMVVTVLVVFAHLAGWGHFLELKLLDVRLRHFSDVQARSDIVVLAIDDNALNQVGRWPWPRRYIASLINLCSQADARMVLLDIIMPEEQPLELHQTGVTDISRDEPTLPIIGNAQPQKIDNDQILAQAIRKAGNVIMPVHAVLARKKFPFVYQSQSNYHNSIDSNGNVGSNGNANTNVKGNADSDSKQNNAARLARRVLNILNSNDNISFTRVFKLIWPHQNILLHNQSYYQLLRIYQQCKAQKQVARFGFEREDKSVHIPVFYMADFTAPIAILGRELYDCGFVSVTNDSDGVVRRISLLGKYRGRYYKQITFAAVLDRLGIANIDIDMQHPDELILHNVNYDNGKPANNTDDTRAAQLAINNSKIVIPLDKNGQMLINWTGDWAKQARQGHDYFSVTQVASLWEKQNAIKTNNMRLQAINTLTYQLSTVPADISSLDNDTRRTIANMRRQLAQLGSRSLLQKANAQLKQEFAQGMAQLRKMVANKIVLVGSVATGAADDFDVTPFNKMTPGIAIHRNILNTILQRNFIKQLSSPAELAMILLLGLIMTVIAACYRPLISGVALFMLLGITVTANFWLLFGYLHYWANLTGPLTVILCSFTAVTFYRQITEGRARHRITMQFKQYTSPAVVDKIVNTANRLTLNGELRNISCFFSDLQGFTAISERLGPQKTVQVLNVYLDRMTEVLDNFDATVNKFEGDGVFAFFGAPVAQSDYALRACQAALQSQSTLAQLVKQQQQQTNDGFPSLTMRIGISTGEVVVGNCGSHRRFDYTAIGDTVNLGARLESANKVFGSNIMICENTWRQVKGVLAGRYLGRVRVVGKKIGVGVYELIDHRDKVTPEQEEYFATFAHAVNLYQKAQLKKARAAFTLCLEQNPLDKAALIYIHTIETLLKQPLPCDFNGDLELTQK